MSKRYTTGTNTLHSVVLLTDGTHFCRFVYALSCLGTDDQPRKYRQFVEKGIDVGRRPELVGGGLIRSVGGWKMAKTLLNGPGCS